MDCQLTWSVSDAAKNIENPNRSAAPFGSIQNAELEFRDVLGGCICILYSLTYFEIFLSSLKLFPLLSFRVAFLIILHLLHLFADCIV